MSEKLEQFMSSLGQPGRYQLAMVLCLCIVSNTMIAVNYSFHYTIFPTEHHCKVPEGVPWSENQSIPFEVTDKGIVYEKCKMYTDPGNTSLGTTTNCPHGYRYPATEPRGQVTITTEWDLVCDKLYWGTFYKTLSFGGIILGGVLAGFFSDKFGRKPIFIVSLMCQAVALIGIYFTTNLQVSMFLAFLRGLFCQATLTVGGIFVMETVSQKDRSWVGVALGCSGSTALAWSTFCAQFFPNWRDSSVILISPTFLILFISWLLVESPRWLLTRGLTEDAFKVSTRITSLNSIQLSADAKDELKDIVQVIKNDKPVTGFSAILQLLRNKKMLKYSLILVISGFSGQLVSYGLVYSLRSFGGNTYVTAYVIAAIDLVARPFAYYPIIRWGRRATLIGALFVLSASFLGAAILGHFGGQVRALFYVAITVVIFAKINIGFYWSAYHLLINELFPTSARNSITGCLGSISRTGPVFMQYILLLGDLYWKHLPYMVYSFLCLTGAIISLLLPETKDKAMPNTVTAAATIANAQVNKNTLQIQNPANDHQVASSKL